nr:SH3 domain-containing protein [Aminobacter sp. HY435]
MKMPFKLGAARQPRPATMFMKTDHVSWRENAPNRGLILGVLAMTALMSATAVSALFILPHMSQRSADVAQETLQNETVADAAKEKITTITAEPTGRKNRVATSASSLLVSEANAAEDPEMPLAADPRWAKVVAAGATTPLEAMPAIPGAEKIIVRDPADSEALALADTGKTDPAATAAVKAIVKEPAADAGAAVIKRSVNMRSKPGGAVLGVIPAKTAVELVACTKWCEIVYKGQRGFVYKSYIQ